jgi:hypothetical protein
VARAIALLAALAPVVVGLSPVDAALRPWLAIAAGVALAVAVAVLPARGRRSGTLVLVAAALAITAGLLGAEARRRHDERAARNAAPHVDLREASLPDPVPPWIELRGHFHDGWLLDEYAVEAGDRPDQSKPAEAVLVPFVGSDAEVVALEGPIVIARVQPAQARLVGAQTIRGRTRAASPEILAVLVQVAGVQDASAVRGVIVDTLDVGPVGGLPWIHALLAALATIAAAIVYSRVVQRPS